jgi:hypothetical protein
MEESSVKRRKGMRMLDFLQKISLGVDGHGTEFHQEDTGHGAAS